MKQVTIPALLLLAACGGGGGGGGSDSSSAPTNTTGQQLSFATTDSDASSNGLPFANSASTVADVEGAGEIDIKVVRALTDYDSGTTQLVISDETVTIDNFEGADLDVLTITLDGETFVVGGANPTDNANGEPWFIDRFTSGDASETLSILSYAGEENPDFTGEFDSEAFFVVGFETDPDEIANLVGEIIYTGEFAGFGQLIDADGTDINISSEVFIGGDIDITANFNDDTADGVLTAVESDISFDTEFSADIEGNGFAANLTCTNGCTDSASGIAGAFYGEDGLETSGIIGFDVQTEEGQFIGGAGFTAE